MRACPGAEFRPELLPEAWPPPLDETEHRRELEPPGKSTRTNPYRKPERERESELELPKEVIVIQSP